MITNTLFKLSSTFKNKFFYTFLLGIFLFRIPSFYILPGVTNNLLTTQILARGLIILAFTHVIFTNIRSSNKLIGKEAKATVFLILLFFIIQSLSVIAASNMEAYLSRFKELPLGLMSFHLFYHFRHQYKKIALMLIAPMFVNILYQLSVFFLKDFYISVLSGLVYDKQAFLVLMNMERSRIYLETYDEAFIPLLFLTECGKNSLNLLFLAFISFISFLSNWRIRVIMLLGSVISAFWIYAKKRIQLFMIIVSVLIIAFFTSIFSTNIQGLSFYDRFFNNEQLDLVTVMGRVEQVKESLSMGGRSLLGVGLGNYYDNLPNNRKIYQTVNRWERAQVQIANEYTHNLIGMTVAETGYIGGIVFILIILYFLKHDWGLLGKGNKYQQSIAIAFWMLFLYGFFNPPVSGTFQILFWGIRGMLF